MKSISDKHGVSVADVASRWVLPEDASMPFAFFLSSKRVLCVDEGRRLIHSRRRPPAAAAIAIKI